MAATIPSTAWAICGISSATDGATLRSSPLMILRISVVDFASMSREAGFCSSVSKLDAERTATAAGALHVRVIEFEPGAFQRLDVVYFGAVQIEQAGLVDENLQVAVVVILVQHVRRVFEGHGVAETGAAAGDHGDPESVWLRLLAIQNLLHFSDSSIGQSYHNLYYAVRSAIRATS